MYMGGLLDCARAWNSRLHPRVTAEALRHTSPWARTQVCVCAQVNKRLHPGEPGAALLVELDVERPTSPHPQGLTVLPSVGHRSSTRHRL